MTFIACWNVLGHCPTKRTYEWVGIIHDAMPMTFSLYLYRLFQLGSSCCSRPMLRNSSRLPTSLCIRPSGKLDSSSARCLHWVFCSPHWIGTYRRLSDRRKLTMTSRSEPAGWPAWASCWFYVFRSPPRFVELEMARSRVATNLPLITRKFCWAVIFWTMLAFHMDSRSENFLINFVRNGWNTLMILLCLAN